MKKLALMLCCLSFAAQAEVISQGGFGTDGASGESMPLKTSVQDAAKIYKALNVNTDGRGKKNIQLADESNFECSGPYGGISRVSADCLFMLRASQNVKVVRGRGLSGTVTFRGPLATAIYKALSPSTATMRAGASVREVANLSCTKVSRPGIEATCTLTNTNVLSMDVPL